MEDISLQTETARLLPDDETSNTATTRPQRRYRSTSFKETIMRKFQATGVASSVADFEKVLVIGGSFA